jgi:hypothetical protein
MNLQTVITNLRNTIAGKEKYLAECKCALDNGITKTEVHISLFTTHEFLRVNIAELKRILQDLEVCIPGDPHSNMPEGWRISK